MGVFAVQHGKIQKSERRWSAPGRGTGISSPVRVYRDSASTANSHTSPSGEVSAMMDVIFTVEFQARFWAKVNKDAPNGCWEWNACLIRGYGQVNVGKKKRARAHRVSYLMAIGPIPDGFEIDHLCRNTKCVNPDHLEAVTPRVNTLRSEGITAKNARKTHCPQGHPYDLANTRIRADGYRECRECKRQAWGDWKRRKVVGGAA